MLGKLVSYRSSTFRGLGLRHSDSLCSRQKRYLIYGRRHSVGWHAGVIFSAGLMGVQNSAIRFADIYFNL